jgi:hypothetical protein
MIRRPSSVALWTALALAAAGCSQSSADKDKNKDGTGTLKASAPEQLPPPSPAVFGTQQAPLASAVPPETPTGSAAAAPEDVKPLGAAPPLSDVAVQPVPTLSLLFQRYGTACYGLDWRFLKSVAEAESSLDPKNHTGKYIGLFQLEPGGGPGDTCGMFIGPFKKYLDCTNLEDAETNTAVAAHRFDRMFRGRRDFAKDPGYTGILEVCPKASAEAAAALAYVGHNNGPGVLFYVLAHARKSGACRLDKQEQAVRAFYRDPAIGNDQGLMRPENGQPAKPCPNAEELKGKWSYECVSEDYGARKWKYGVNRVAKPLEKAGISSLYGPEDPSKCPALAVPPQRLTPKAP